MTKPNTQTIYEVWLNNDKGNKSIQIYFKYKVAAEKCLSLMQLSMTVASDSGCGIDKALLIIDGEPKEE